MTKLRRLIAFPSIYFFFLLLFLLSGSGCMESEVQNQVREYFPLATVWSPSPGILVVDTGIHGAGYKLMEEIFRKFASEYLSIAGAFAPLTARVIIVSTKQFDVLWRIRDGGQYTIVSVNSRNTPAYQQWLR